MFDQGKHLTAVPGLLLRDFDASTPCDTQVFSTLLAMEFNKKEKNGTRYDDFFTMTLNDHPMTRKASIYHGVLGWLI